MTRRWLAAAACLLALAGCTGVPTSSAPRTVEPIRIGNDDRVLPGPADGADARTIVQGFLDANAVDPTGHDTARKYLSGPVRSQWSDATATIISGRAVSTVQNGVVTVTGRLVGSLSQNGVYVPQLQGTGDGVGTETFRYRVATVKGQNRVVDLPPGLVLTTDQFAQAYRPHALYFFDQARRTLVPDSRWTSLDGSRLSAWLVGQLANGPRPDLSSTLTNDTLPPQANARRITAKNGTPIKIEIPGAAQLDARGKRQLAAQVSATVTDPTSDESVQLTDGGSAVPMPGGARVFTAREAAYAFTPVPPSGDVFYLRNGQVVRDGGGTLGKLRSSPLFLNSIAVSQPVGSSGFTVAGVNGAGASARLVIGTQAAGYRTTTISGQLSRPSWVPAPPPGSTVPPEVWVGDGNRLLRVVVDGNKAVSSEVSINAAVGGRIVALRLSPEGARIALVIESVNGGRRLFVGSIVRGAGQVRVDALLPISPEGVTVNDAGWVGAEKLIAVGSITASNDPRVFETNVDGSSWTSRALGPVLPGPPDSVTVAVSQLAWVSTNRTVWRQAPGRSWESPNGKDQTAGDKPAYLE